MSIQSHAGRGSRLARQIGGWISGRIGAHADARPLAAFDELSDHLLRDAGLRRDPLAGPTRYNTRI